MRTSIDRWAYLRSLIALVAVRVAVIQMPYVLCSRPMAETDLMDGSGDLLSGEMPVSSHAFTKMFSEGENADIESEDSDDGGEVGPSLLAISSKVSSSGTSDEFRFPYEPCLGPSRGHKSSEYKYHDGCDGSEEYHMGDFLGQGTFCKVYAGKDPDGKDVALKQEQIGGKELKTETRLKELLRDLPGIPRYFDTWSDHENNYAATELLGKTLKIALSEEGGKLPMRKVLNIGKVMVDIIAGVHGRGLLHHDLKPQNILFDRGGGKLYLIDFGLSERWKDKDGQVQPYVKRNTWRIRGTARYSAIRSHFGTLSPADELESLGYILVYLAKGELPWQGLHHEDQQDLYKKILTLKRTVTTKQLVAGLPPAARDAFTRFFSAVRGRPYEEGLNPDYQALADGFDEALQTFKDQADVYAENTYETASDKRSRLKAQQANVLEGEKKEPSEAGKDSHGKHDANLLDGLY
eukprot:TRINITY_DN17710_c0_g1_i1.p1 TRINITY_DN17710_c0_g1~~TRINITY_DN17710_c0_g1_i1.p1  ORF type:complete len:464 (-),score=70.10 TRINITY_DN17710_c0_g1_i1:227-1618(-)